MDGSRAHPMALKQNVGYVDLIVLGKGEEVDYFARNAQGFHVPITTMEYKHQVAAYVMKLQRGW